MSKIGLFGLGLLLIPPILIALSPKYQLERPGDSYIEVYLCCFGLSLLLALALYRFKGRSGLGRLSGGTLLLIGVGFLYGANFESNASIVRALNKYCKYPRIIAQRAIETGLLSDVAENSLVFLEPAFVWQDGSFVADHARRRVNAHVLGEKGTRQMLAALGGVCTPTEVGYGCSLPNAFLLRQQSLGNGQGVVMLLHLVEAEISSDAVTALFADRADLFFSFVDSPFQPLLPAITGRDITVRGGDRETREFRLQNAELTTISSGTGWKRVRMRRKLYDAGSLHGFLDAHAITPQYTQSHSRPSEAFLLTPGGANLLHKSFAGSAWEAGIEIGTINLHPPFSVEVLVKPDSIQSTAATILSNHAVAFSGLSIEQRSDDTNKYSIYLGSGKAYVNLADVSIEGGRLHYLSIQVSKHDARTFLDGRLAASKALNFIPPDSSLPFRLGNWLGGNRPFHGVIKEVLFASENRSQKDIQEQARRILQPLVK